MGSAPKLWLVVNRDSGSNDSSSVDRLRAALIQAGQAPERILDSRRAELPTPTQLQFALIDRVAIFAGDGTVNAVCHRLEGWDGEVAVLPGGTANLLARSLHGEAVADEIVSRLAEGRLKRVRRSCIQSSQGVALSEILAGPGASWSDVREELRDHHVGGVAAKAVEAIRQSATGPMVAIIGPAMGKESGYAGVRLAPEGNRMSVEGYGAETIADYVKQGVAVLRRDFRTGPHDDLGTAAELSCRSLGGDAIELMIDGERRTGGPEERFTVRPFDLTFLASPPEARDA